MTKIIRPTERRLEKNAGYLNGNLRFYTKILMLGCLLIAAPAPLKGQEPISQGASKLSNLPRTEGYDIRLELQTSKPVYRVGDPIFIVAYLENESNKNYLIGKSLTNFNVFTPFHFIELRVVDEGGNEVSGQRIFAHPDPSELSAETISNKITRRYLLLEPGMIHGLKVRGRMSRKPGHYRYTAIYREVDALHWPRVERDALPIPVWTQTLISNTLTITVLPRKR